MKRHFFPMVLVTFSVLSLITSCDSSSYEEIRGCTDAAAINYNAEANLDDNSCVTISDKQNSLMLLFTSTSCADCGATAIPAFQSLLSKLSGQVLALRVQQNDALSTPESGPVSAALSGKYNCSPIPAFALNNTCYKDNTSNFISLVETQSQNTPQVGVGIRYTVGAGINAGKLNINVYAKAFQNFTGEYYATTYIIAKKIEAEQTIGSSSNPEFVHRNVIIGIADQDVWGTKLKQGTLDYTAGEIIHLPFTYEYNTDWALSDITLHTVIWKKAGNKYEFVNCSTN